MASIAEFANPAEEFALRETHERRPEPVCEVDRTTASSGDPQTRIALTVSGNAADCDRYDVRSVESFSSVVTQHQLLHGDHGSEALNRGAL